MSTLSEKLEASYGAGVRVQSIVLSVPVSEVEDIQLGDFVEIAGKDPAQGFISSADNWIHSGSKRPNLGLNIEHPLYSQPIRDSRGNWLIKKDELIRAFRTVKLNELEVLNL